MCVCEKEFALERIRKKCVCFISKCVCASHIGPLHRGEILAYRVCAVLRPAQSPCRDMKTICLYFEIHQIIHLKRYRCFDIGRDHYYYDDYENERGISDIAERSYIPALSALIEMAKNQLIIRF